MNFKKYTISALLFLLIFCNYNYSQKAGSVKLSGKDLSSYVLVYFKDNTHSLYFALSDDGYTFTDVNDGNPIVSGDSIAEQKGVRDPYIMRGKDGWFYMAMTDLHLFAKQRGFRATDWERDGKLYGWGNNRGLVLMKSKDLVHWSHSILDISKAFPELNVGCVWAPEMIYDEKAKKIMIYFTMRLGNGRTKLYYSYMNKAFSQVETKPEILFEYPDTTKQILDADITKLPDGRFCMMYVAQENPGGIKMAFSNKINSGYVYQPQQIDFEPRSCEAPNVWKRSGTDKWVLMYDIFSINPHNFGFAETSDFVHFTNLGHFNEGVLKTTNFITPKHGAVMSITKEEADRLRNFWQKKKEERKPIDSVQNTSFKPGEIWPDNHGKHINAHGGGIVFYKDRYYWFGEYKISGRLGNSAQVGVSCYSSPDLVNWKDEGIALKVENDTTSDIRKGCVIERPKVIYNEKTKKFIMWFHLELKGKGYGAARTAVAESDNVTGPYKYIRSLRPNAGVWPMAYKEEWKQKQPGEDTLKWWTDTWRKAVEEGLFVRKDFNVGQMSRDMGLFVDEDGKAYHIHASEENLTIHVSELTDDYLSFTGKWITVFPGGHNEAPAMCKHNGKYYLITSGCTGWAPNAARSAVADHIWGPWKALGNPCEGEGSDKTFSSQSTFILPVQGKKDAFIFMADRWVPNNPIDGRYIWLPLIFENEKPLLRWKDQWDLSFFR